LSISVIAIVGHAPRRRDENNHPNVGQQTEHPAKLTPASNASAGAILEFFEVLYESVIEFGVIAFCN
jgi:hypothetical protein